MANYTLTAAINGATTPIGVTPAYALTGSGYPGRLSCESETMYVTGGDGTNLISVLRGQDGTDAVAHTFGTTIADANLGTGGGVQTVSLLGPFTVNFDDFGGVGGNFPLAITSLPIGSILINAWVEVVTNWSGGDLTNATMVLETAPDADLTNGNNLVNELRVHTNDNAATYRPAAIAGVAFLFRTTRIVGAASLIAYMNTLDGTPTAGSATIYALLATPS